MGWWGATIAGAIGGAIGSVFGPAGTIAGAVLLASIFDDEETLDPNLIWFGSTFFMLGKFAKADGVVSKAEIQAVEDIIKKLELNDETRLKAIELFNQAKNDPELDFDSIAKKFYDAFKDKEEHLIFIIACLFNVAKVNNQYLPVHEKMILSVIRIFNLDNEVYIQIKEQYFPSVLTFTDNLNDKYYQALGCNKNDSNQKIKESYKKLQQHYHPDKLAAHSDLPQAIKDLVASKSREINEAYQAIRKERGF